MTRTFLLATFVYAAITLVLGMTWHFILFKDLYDSLGIYNRQEPIIPLGFTSMLLQGLIIAYLYPSFNKGGHPISQGIKFALLMGLFMFSVSTLANAAKIHVASMSTWLMVQTAFHLIQFTVVGVGIGLIYGPAPREHAHGL